MPVHHLPLIQSTRPRSFHERGVVAPFTTPMLAGARLRRLPRPVCIAGERSLVGPLGGPLGGPPAVDRLRDTELEIIVPNPSGGRGVYILPWSDIGALCRPTLHDAMLGRSLSTPLDGTERELTPLRLRDAARRIAAQGLAGREAGRAAEQADARRADGLVATRFTLLMVVTQQIEARGDPGPPLVHETPSEIERRGGLALIRLASDLGQPPQLMADLLDLLALQYVDVGVGLGMADASLSRIVSRLGVLRHELTVWAQSERHDDADHSNQVSRAAQAVTGAAELAARMARLLLDAARARLGDMQALFQNMLTAQADVTRACERASWLLDGWEPICVLWQAAPSLLSRLEAIREIHRRIPLLPDEAEAWLGLKLGTADLLFRRPATDQGASTETLSQLERIARNEHLRAMAG